jgi:hypothetical protein
MAAIPGAGICQASECQMSSKTTSMAIEGHPRGQDGVTSDVSQLQLSMKLDQLVVERLFGDGPWLTDKDRSISLHRMLDGFGLQEQVPGMANTSRLTDLGLRLNLDLLIVFLGLHWEWEVPEILEQHHFVEKEEVTKALHSLEAGSDPEQVLRGLVQKAYFHYYGRSKMDTLTGRNRKE